MNKLLIYILSLIIKDNNLESFNLNKSKISDFILREKNICSVIVYKDEDIIFEEYFNNYHKDTIIELRSITKNILSILIGLAIKEGLIKSVEQNIVDFFPELVEVIVDPRFYSIKVKHLLTMTSGISYCSSLDTLNKFKALADPIKHYFKTKLEYNPGEVFNYSEVDAHMLSAIISRVTGYSAKQFGSERLFEFMDINEFEWDCDKQGINYGGSELNMKSIDLIKIGQLYLNNGNFMGNQIVPESWVKESLQIHNQGGSPVYQKYGYLWWISDFSKYTAYLGFGYGGQFLYIVPDFNTIIEISAI